MRRALQNAAFLNRPHVQFTLGLHKLTRRICHRLGDVACQGVDIEAPSAGRFLQKGCPFTQVPASSAFAASWCGVGYVCFQ